jgi:hypothetical protein
LQGRHGPHQSLPPARNPQLRDLVAWLNLTLADGRDLDDDVLTSPGSIAAVSPWFRDLQINRLRTRANRS